MDQEVIVSLKKLVSEILQHSKSEDKGLLTLKMVQTDIENLIETVNLSWRDRK